MKLTHMDGTLVMNKILEVCLKNGAELGEPGEFTKRAFLNGRIDLSQAEAVIDIINAKTEKEARASIKQLNRRFISKLRKNKRKVNGNNGRHRSLDRLS